VGNKLTFDGLPSPSANDLHVMTVSGMPLDEAETVVAVTVSVTAAYTAPTVGDFSDGNFRHLFNFGGLVCARVRLCVAEPVARRGTTKRHCLPA
jgi:hypothetical protein